MREQTTIVDNDRKRVKMKWKLQAFIMGKSVVRNKDLVMEYKLHSHRYYFKHLAYKVCASPSFL